MRYMILNTMQMEIGFVDSDSRGIYGGCDGNSYQGFVTEDGNVFDDNHNKMGCVNTSGEIFDNNNIRLGWVSELGEVFDNSDSLVGRVEKAPSHIAGGSGLLLLLHEGSC